MGILYKTKVYTIGHMQYADGKGWREKVKEEFAPMGITVFDPYFKPFLNSESEDDNSRAQMGVDMANGDYDKVHKRMKSVRSDDLRLCDYSDFLIVNIAPKIASWGSAEEFFWCNRMKKPIFLAVEGGKKATPLWIMGTIPHKYIFNDIDEIISLIKKIDAGEVAIDNYRWKLLKPEYRE